MNKYIKSPLNYTGNKYRILPQLIPHFPQKIGTMVDLFCGGATVGLNVNCDLIIFIDNDPRVINLLKFLAKSDFDSLLLKLEEIIKKYNLSYSYKNGYNYYFKQLNEPNKNNGLKQYNEEGFYKIRDYYNSLTNKNTDEANTLLYILLVYGFNNDLRFNNLGEHNLPIGKTDLNKNNILKLKAYIDRMKKINAKFVCGDFREEKIKNFLTRADFIYLDPPYLITDAVYNETSGWNEVTERELLDMLDSFIMQKKHFMLSNVISKKGKINEPLSTWVKNRMDQVSMIDINYHYRSSSYNKINRQSCEKEIILVYKEDA